MTAIQSFDLLPGGRSQVGSGPLTEAPANKVLQATVYGTGAVTASVDIEGSVLGDGWVFIGNITLSGTNMASDGFPSSAPWPMVRANVKSLSVGATVTAGVGG